MRLNHTVVPNQRSQRVFPCYHATDISSLDIWATGNAFWWHCTWAFPMAAGRICPSGSQWEAWLGACLLQFHVESWGLNGLKKQVLIQGNRSTELWESQFLIIAQNCPFVVEISLPLIVAQKRRNYCSDIRNMTEFTAVYMRKVFVDFFPSLEVLHSRMENLELRIWLLCYVIYFQKLFHDVAPVVALLELSNNGSWRINCQGRSLVQLLQDAGSLPL